MLWSTMEFEFVTLEKAGIKVEISTCWYTTAIILLYCDLQAPNMCAKFSFIMRRRGICA